MAKKKFDTIVVPFGAHPDQIFNLLDIGARDIYHQFFERPADYLGDARRLRSTWTEEALQHRPLFAFLNRHRYALNPCCFSPWMSAAPLASEKRK